jgi:hypothetical protein
MALSKVNPNFVNQLGRRNLIINGAMQVAQRGSSAVTIGTSGDTFRADRFRIEQGGMTANNGTIEVVADAPTGFKYSTKLTGGSSVTQNSAGFAALSTRIEGSDLDHVGHGSSAAKNATLSFWVKSSVTGTYSLNMTKYDGTQERWQVKTYTISTANTWEYKTLTFSGDTSNTAVEWLRLYWQVGGDSGAYTNTTPDVWINGAGAKRGTSSQPNFLGTSGATFNLTGVQLEVGSVATDFEHRSYGEELVACQRYYYQFDAAGAGNKFGSGWASSTTTGMLDLGLPVTMRALPSVTITNCTIWDSAASYTPTAVVVTGGPFPGSQTLQITSSSLTTYRPFSIRSNAAGVTITLSSEL